jgi:hypothetical protein
MREKMFKPGKVVEPWSRRLAEAGKKTKEGK